MSLPSQQEPDKSKIAFPDYPLYPVDDEIYNQSSLQENIDLVEISKTKPTTTNYLNSNS